MENVARKPLENPFNANLITLLDHTDTVIDRLAKAKALSSLLNGAREYPDEAVTETTALIAELIHEALEAHCAQWEEIRRYAQENRC